MEGSGTEFYTQGPSELEGVLSTETHPTIVFQMKKLMPKGDLFKDL